MDEAPLLEIAGLEVALTSRAGTALPVLRDIDLAVRRGESVGIVGESGSGKSTLLLAAMGHLRRGLARTSGAARFAGRDMLAMPPAERQAIRGRRVAMIPQNSGQALTPNLRVGAQIAEVLDLHATLPPGARPARVRDLLAQVRLPDPGAIAARYPHELSGGQQQRVAIAMALAGSPELLLLDEPTTGLDVTTQAHILDLLATLADGTGTTMVYVSHDLGAIARVCRRVVVMYGGEIVLDGPATTVLRAPAHPYASGLLASIPLLSAAGLPVALDGRPPALDTPRQGCAFAPRCALAAPRCREEAPALAPQPGGARLRCHFPERVGELRRERPPQPHAVAGTAGRTVVLDLDRLAVSYAKPRLADQILGRTPRATPTVDRVALHLREGEAIGLVGESGSGKSTILRAIAGLIAPAGGRIGFRDDATLPPTVDRRAPAQLRAIQLVFQNPDESLNPRQTVAQILAQPLGLYFGLSGAALRARSAAALAQVRLGAQFLDRLPAQLSGGEKQRVAIARAFAAEPDLVLCDEVTSALDVSVQAAVLALLDRLRREKGTTFVFVSHDLAVVRAIADRVAVLYQGRICEIGPTAAVYAKPCHPYTEALLAAVLEPVPGRTPALLGADIVERAPPARGCPFQRRCHRSLGTICERETPPARDAGEGHMIHCHLPLDELRRAQAGAAP